MPASGSSARASRRRDRRARSRSAPPSSSTATGVWTDDIQTMAGGRGRFHVRASKGVHIVVPRDRINSETGLILRTEKSVLFVIPWGTHWIIGTTDTDWTLDRAHPAASRADIDYILEHVNSVLDGPADPRRHPGRLRRSAAAAVGRERVDTRSCRASTPSPGRSPGSSRSRAASTRPTG